MASKRHVRRKACTGKRRFASHGEALGALFALRRQKGWVGWMTPYHCQFCHQFHFGHPPARVRQSLAAIRGQIRPDFIHRPGPMMAGR